MSDELALLVLVVLLDNPWGWWSVSKPAAALGQRRGGLTGVAHHDNYDGAIGATSRNLNAEGRPVQLRFLGKETTGGQSPTLYATDQDSYVVQGWIVTNDDVLAKLDLEEDETVVEVYSRLLSHLAKDGLSGEVTSQTYPIVHVTEDGTYVLQGKQLADIDTLAQMDIPGHETAIEIPRSVMAGLVKGR